MSVGVGVVLFMFDFFWSCDNVSSLQSQPVPRIQVTGTGSEGRPCLCCWHQWSWRRAARLCHCVCDVWPVTAARCVTWSQLISQWSLDGKMCFSMDWRSHMESQLKRLWWLCDFSMGTSRISYSTVVTRWIPWDRELRAEFQSEIHGWNTLGNMAQSSAQMLFACPPGLVVWGTMLFWQQ